VVVLQEVVVQGAHLGQQRVAVDQAFVGKVNVQLEEVGQDQGHQVARLLYQGLLVVVVAQVEDPPLQYLA
jgi:hypothetical protein